MIRLTTSGHASERNSVNEPTDPTAQPVSLTKHHGLGNDFLVALEPAAPLGPDHARRWCDRRLGIGADGLIVSEPIDGADGHRWSMVLWNADGGRAEISGNGIRCLGQAIARRLKLDPAEAHRLVIETDAGARTVDLQADGAGPDGASGRAANERSLRVGMGPASEGPPPSDRWSEVGVAPIEQLGVDIGNPHLVALVDAGGGSGAADGIDRFDMAEVGPVIEADYPGGLNVHLVEVLDRSRVRLKVWERGAGVTRACGTGACAAGWAAHRLGLVDDVVTVAMPGGDAIVELDDPSEVRLIGPATLVGEVILDA